MSGEGEQDGKAPNPPGSGGEAPGRERNQPAAAPVIALRMEALLQWVAERVAKFPREHKFIVGDRLMETCLGVLEHLVEASYKRDKVAELAAASRLLVRARIVMRLARGLHCVSEAQHLSLARTSRIGPTTVGPSGMLHSPPSPCRPPDSRGATSAGGARRGPPVR